jgi:hypothetical protein
MNTPQSDRELSEARGHSQRGSRFWMLFPGILLGVSVSGWLWMVSMAVNDPGFSVERDYYKKGANFDEEIARRANNQRLAWNVCDVDVRTDPGPVGYLTVGISDESGMPLGGLSLKAEAFPVARGQDVRHLVFVPVGEGRYEVRLDRLRLGLWSVRLLAERAETSFTHELRVEFNPVKGPHS